MVPGGHETGREWIEALPAELDGQKAIMRGLLDWCEGDERAKYLVVACSVGRGAADRLSDLDMGLGLESPDFDAALADAHQVIDSVGGELVESYHHKIPGLAMPHERIFAQYANRCQVDMVVIPAPVKYPGVKDEVVLYDPESIRAAKWVPTEVTSTQVREWAFNGWACLADVGKYLRRGSAWEALERLHQARAEYWRLLATVHDVPNPQYGVTSLLDFAPEQVPASLAATASDVYLTHLLRAARNLAAELAGVGTQLPPEFRAVLPNAMAAFITADLELVEAGHQKPN
ncbi:MAG TPA: hypothetical protein VN767_27055 [Streptosporangiaceae bacterium]|nr:hypothetical protein [Streptosporangiaceae bacterium]